MRFQVSQSGTEAAIQYPRTNYHKTTALLHAADIGLDSRGTHLINESITNDMWLD